MIDNRMQNIKPIHQQGFTLIELMISIVLGLLVIAAATAIFLSAQRSMNMQMGMSELQQNSIFGLSQIAHDIRHLNLNTSQNQTITRTGAGSGIIFSAQNFDGVMVPNRFFTAERQSNTNMNERSDVLTIQFKPSIGSIDPNKDDSLVNCEGTKLVAGQTNVQVYYVQPVAGTTGQDRRFNLMCDAGTNAVGGGGATPIGSGAVVVLQDVEAFKVRLVVRDRNDDIVYRVPSAVGVGANVADRVVGVEVGLVARSNSSVGSNNNIDAGRTFRIAGTDVRLGNPRDQDKYLRQEFNQVVAIRNAQGGN